MSRALLQIAGPGFGLIAALGAEPALDRVPVQAPPPAERILDARALRSLHLDLLGRPPFHAEIETTTGKPMSEVVPALIGRVEFCEHWFEEQLYYFLLVNNFRPQSERIASIPAELAAHKLDVREAIHRIALSANFDQRNPGADTFVTVVMEQLTGLEVQKNPRDLEIGKKLYDGAEGTFLGVAGRSQADVVRIAVSSRAFVKHFLAREYERLVHGKPDAAELNASIAEFAKDPAAYPRIVERWILSDAYRVRLEARVAMGNRLFVRCLFVDLMDRMPTQDESEPMRQALDGLSDPAPLRAVLVRMMLDSPRVAVEKREAVADAAAWIRARFLRYFGREPGDAELAAFVAAWAEPECRPQTILCALLSSPEYQRF